MNPYSYANNSLHCEQTDLAALAQQYGTPLYVYSRSAIESSFLAYQSALGGRAHTICYAVKANSNLAVLNCLARCGAGFDIVSAGELQRVLAAGGDPAKVVFSGVAKTASDMKLALAAGIKCFNVESADELERLNDVAISMDVVAPVSLRVNPDVDAKTHPYISTGLKENKFGVSIEQAPAIYQRALSLRGVNPVGVDCHIGSQLTEIAPFCDATDRLLALVDTVSELGVTLEHLDLGGGLGVPYEEQSVPSIGDYVDALVTKLGDRPLELLFEPGRSIVAMSGVLLTEVEYLKPTEHRNFAIVDAGMNDLIRPSLYSAWQEILPVKPRQGDDKAWDIVGPVCETGDFLGKERAMTLAQGDLLAVMGAGAYGFVMASNYNSRPRPPEIMVDGQSHHVIRARETVETLWAGEQLLPESSQ